MIQIPTVSINIYIYIFMSILTNLFWSHFITSNNMCKDCSKLFSVQNMASSPLEWYRSVKIFLRSLFGRVPLETLFRVMFIHAYPWIIYIEYDTSVLWKLFFNLVNLCICVPFKLFICLCILWSASVFKINKSCALAFCHPNKVVYSKDRYQFVI